MTVLSCEQILAGPRVALAGGKGRNLYALTAAGFPVPRWVILGTDVFDAALSDLGLVFTDAPLSLEERLGEAARVESVLRESPIPLAAQADIKSALVKLGASTVAVRSSARQEDGQFNSFAGMFDSFLNVSGLQAVEDAVRRCWASAFSARVTRYRYVRGVGFGDVAIAVIIQHFVDPVSSGVMFTADPVTGSSDSVMISGVLGLGEGLVSGTVDSDSVLIAKGTREVLDEAVVSKTRTVTAAGRGGVATVDVPADRQRDPAIAPEVRASLVELALRLDRYCGGPQDVEWAYDGSTTWILQARPITALPQQGFAAPEHIGETVAAGEVRIWDNSNIIESFAGVTSPLTFTVARKLYGDVYLAYARSLDVPPAQLEQMKSWLPVMLGQFNGHVYYNLLHWYRMVGIAPGYALNRRVLEVALGVGETLDAKTAKSLQPFVFPSLRTRLAARARITLTYVRRSFAIDAMMRDFDSDFAEFITRQGFTDMSRIDGAQAHRHFRQTHQEVADIWGPMLVLDAILLTSVGLLAVLMKLFLPRAPEWVGFALLNPGPDVVSIEPARALVDLARFVDTAPALREFIDSVDTAVAYPRLAESAQASGEPHWRELLARVDDYIDRFGYRCIDELKLEAPDLRQDPAGLFHLLRMATPQDEHRTGDSAEEYLDAHLRGLRRRVFDALRGKIQRAATHREHLRFCRARGFGIIKSLAAVMGRDLARRGVIGDWKDVFLLRLDELYAVYDGGLSAGQAHAVVARRRMLDQRYRRLAAPGRFTTAGSEYSAAELAVAGWREDAESECAQAGTVLTGTPSSPGMVTGRAVVVDRPEDFSSGILVAYRTEPSWAAVLPFASALLVERASPLTHVAIIARELGVPTVVQIDGLTAAIRTGMTVSVDGARGRVVVLDGESPCQR